MALIHRRVGPKISRNIRTGVLSGRFLGGVVMRLLDAFTGTMYPAPGSKAAPPAQLSAALLALNRPTAPWHIREAQPHEKCDLIAEWKIVDTRWYEVFAATEIDTITKILLTFEAIRREVRAFDQGWKVHWYGGVPSLSAFVQPFRTPRRRAAMRRDGTFTETTRTGEVHRYRFATGEMKGPLRAIILGAGWTYRGRMFARP